MEALIVSLIPALEGQTTLLVLVSTLFTLYFASMVYSFFFSIFDAFRGR